MLKPLADRVIVKLMELLIVQELLMINQLLHLLEFYLQKH